MRNPTALLALIAILNGCGDEPTEGLYDLPGAPTPYASSTPKPPAASAPPAATNSTPPTFSTPPLGSAPPANVTPPVDGGAPSPTPSSVPPSAPVIALQAHLNPNTGDWLVSRTRGDGAPAYQFMGVNYRVLDAPLPNTRPLYRCVDSFGTHFQSNQVDCERAGTNEGLLGYMFASDPKNGAKIVRRCIGAAGHPIVSTLRISDCAPFIVQNIDLGFAIDP